MNIVNSMVYWKMAWFKYFSGVTKAGCAVFLAGTATMKLDPRVIIALSAYIAMMTFTEGFLDQVISRLQAGKPPVGSNGHTDFLNKTVIPVEVTTKQTTVATALPAQTEIK